MPQPTESEREHMLEDLGADRFHLFLMKQELGLTLPYPSRMDLWAWRDHLRSALRVPVGHLLGLFPEKSPDFPVHICGTLNHLQTSFQLNLNGGSVG